MFSLTWRLVFIHFPSTIKPVNYRLTRWIPQDGWMHFYSNIFHFILFIWFFCFLWAEKPSDMTVPIIPAVVVFVLIIIVAAARFAVYKKKKGERFRSNSAKLSYIISVLLSILNMVILNLCKRVGLSGISSGIVFFSVSERRPASCKYNFIVFYSYFPLWSDSLDLKHYLCNRYIFSLALTAPDNNDEQMQLNQVK